jgi:uncharacterized integral membrane protein
LTRLAAVAGVLLVLFISVSFAVLNGNQLVTLRLGIATFYQVPLSVVAFGALVIGMLLMLVTGIHSDLKVRRILRERLAQEDRDERARAFVDTEQKDLFEERH